MYQNLLSQMMSKITDIHSKSIHSLLGVYLSNGEIASEYIRDRVTDGDRIFLELLVYPDMRIYSVAVITEDSSNTHPDKHCIALEYSFHGENTEEGLQIAMMIRQMVANVLSAYRILAEDPSKEETDYAITVLQKEGIKVLTSYTTDNPTVGLIYS